MATATATVTPHSKSATSGWKSRFLRRGSSTKDKDKIGSHTSGQTNGACNGRKGSDTTTEASSMSSMIRKADEAVESYANATLAEPTAKDSANVIPSRHGNHGGAGKRLGRTLSGMRLQRTKKNSSGNNSGGEKEKGLFRKLKSTLRHSHGGRGDDDEDEDDNEGYDSDDGNDRSSGNQGADMAGPTMLIDRQSSPSNPQSPQSSGEINVVETDVMKKDSLFQWQDQMEEKERREVIQRKQFLKERDGFCRRVDAYDGQVIVVDNKPTYELGNYLGGGVAGVVYEGHRLRPMEDYPVRTGANENAGSLLSPLSSADAAHPSYFFCNVADGACGSTLNVDTTDVPQVANPLSPTSMVMPPKSNRSRSGPNHENNDMAIETTFSRDHGILLDAQDAPSRSRHYAQAASAHLNPSTSPSKLHGLFEETVAVKILNPVGFRILPPDGLDGAVVVKKGEAMDADVRKGLHPMQERHVWWLVNPNSRNLRTLQRYGGKNSDGTKAASRGVQVDRGSSRRGLRLSLIAAFVDPQTSKLRELTLIRCIEIWGHVPFSTSDAEFEDMMCSIERVNAGEPPSPQSAFNSANSRLATVLTGSFGSSTDESSQLHSPSELKPQRTGLVRAAQSSRATVYCNDLDAYIAIPAVPSKYIRWLRQRRAATKEIRNMMLIGRHKNVVHLFEVLEYIQEAKSTMFLILELVKGGELFDLISSNSGNNKNHKNSPRVGDADESEIMMRKFFFELSSGINYCHLSGIAHRDLKPENLLVHHGEDGVRTLKIADFGLSATFGIAEKPHIIFDATDMNDPSGLSSPMSQPSSVDQGTMSPASNTSHTTLSPIKESMDKFIQSGANALSFLTCGAVETLCAPNVAPGGELGENALPLRRMTSVVGSPHYVAPEIISQTEEGARQKFRMNGGVGYDGSKADVWSAGVILYAMLFRSLPFGEDLLRCPRYQSYKKWYGEVRELGGRRSSALGALNPVISDADERDFLGPHWFFPSATSKLSRDLIVAMLNPFPTDRLSIDMVLRHPWLAAERE